MGVLKIIVFVLVPLLVASYVFWFMESDAYEVPTMADKWWGREPAPTKTVGDEEGKPPTPFTIKTSKATLDDLKHRLQNTRLPESLEGTAFNYGLHSDFLRHVVSYWKDKFNWEKQQAELNTLTQFKTKIEGIDIHFVRILPKNTPAGKARRVIMMIHGWPGSFWEFYKVIPQLTGSKKGSKAEDESMNFEVICPSIPGYGFSEAPHKPGFDGSDAARVFLKLMKKLGHDRFYVHGGDWGGLIATIMAKAFPNNIIGVHVNLAMAPMRSWRVLLQLVVGDIWPSLVYSPAELKIRMTVKQTFLEIIRESGYMHIQSTKPDTVAAGLNDSPAGVAAYILEKFSSWTKYENRNCTDGCITKFFTMDEVLTNVMIYWLSGNVGSSMRFYKEHFASEECQQWERVPVLVPSGISAFPHEILRHTRSIVEMQYHNVVHYTDQPRGGHFAAFEEPDLVVDDIKAFVRTVEGL